MAETLETGHGFPAVQPDQRNSVQGGSTEGLFELPFEAMFGGPAINESGRPGSMLDLLLQQDDFLGGEVEKAIDSVV